MMKRIVLFCLMAITGALTTLKPGRYQILYGTSSLDKDLQVRDFVVKSVE